MQALWVYLPNWEDHGSESDLSIHQQLIKLEDL